MNKTRLMVLSFSLLFGFLICLNINGCNRIKAEQTDNAQEVNNGLSEEETTQKELVSSQEQVTDEEKEAEANPSSKAKRSSVRRYARENPFVPLITERAKPKPKKDDKPKDTSKSATKTIKINLISIVDGNKAIFTEDGFVRVLSIGDYIAEMEILRMNSDAAILSSGNNEIYVRIGEQIDVKIAAD